MFDGIRVDVVLPDRFVAPAPEGKEAWHNTYFQTKDLGQQGLLFTITSWGLLVDESGDRMRFVSDPVRFYGGGGGGVKIEDWREYIAEFRKGRLTRLRGGVLPPEGE